MNNKFHLKFQFNQFNLFYSILSMNATTGCATGRRGATNSSLYLNLHLRLIRNSQKYKMRICVQVK